MSLAPGARIGAYEILSSLGSGGMGDVYRARDTRLGRDVAIKILPNAFTSDQQRLARFAREARVLAALNHPHIASIYGLEDHAGTHALVLELVDGETLADRIVRGPVPPRDALAVASQIADALDAAHEKGIVHRDLKPSNVALTRDGSVKVLDFGLALAPALDDSIDLAQHTTVTLTQTGAVLGTTAYMSPEQARGHAVDKRTDIWAFGCVLYELLTGRQAFGRQTSSDTIAAVLEHEPDWRKLRTTPALERIVRRCLEKDVKLRARDIGDVRFELTHALDDAAPAPHVGRRASSRVVLWSAIAALLLAGAGVLMRQQLPFSSDPPPASSPTSATLTRVTADEGVTADPAISRDGSLIAFSSDRSGRSDLDIWIQRSAGGVPIRLTEDEVDEHEPNISPDGSLIAFRSERDGGGIYLIPTFGGQQPRLLAAGGRRPRFSPDGASVAFWVGNNIGFAARPDAYRSFVVPLSGGAPKEIGASMTGVRYPVWSTDGTHILAAATSASSADLPSYDWWLFPVDGGAPVKLAARDTFRQAGIAVDGAAMWPEAWGRDGVLFSDFRSIWRTPIDHGRGRITGAVERLTFGTSREAQPSISSNGIVAFTSFLQPNHIWALPLDADRGVATGDPKRLSSGVGIEARPSASADGSLVLYRSSTLRPTMLLKNLTTGRVTDAGVRSTDYGPALSPDGRWIAFEADEGVSMMPSQGGPVRTLCRDCTIGDWTGPSTGLLVVTRRGFAVVDVADGAVRDVMLSNRLVSRPFPSPDGRVLAFRVTLDTRDSILVAPMDASGMVSEANAKAIAAPEEDARPAGWSPNSRLLYFVSALDGTRCLYARRVNTATGEPEGDAFAVRHFHGTRNVWANSGGVLSTGPANAIRGGYFFYDLATFSGNIWTMSHNAR